MATLIKIDRNGSKHYEGMITCDRCQGRGWFATGVCNGQLVPSKIDQAVCWKCHGAGQVAGKWIERTPEYEAKLEAKRKAKQEARMAEETAKQEEQKAHADEANAAFFQKQGFNAEGKTYVVLGNTFEIKDDLKQLGCKFTGILGWHTDHQLDGAVSSYYRETYAEAEQRLGEVRALRLAGHNNIFPTLSWLNGTATLRVWHPRGPDQVEVWAFCITDKAASDEVKAAFENSATRAFGPAGFLEQDDSENWCEIQKLLKGHRARNSKLCLEMGLGQEKRRDDGIPGITNYIFSETAARGMYQRWADLLSSESWQEVLDKTAAYQQEVMK